MQWVPADPLVSVALAITGLPYRSLKIKINWYKVLLMDCFSYYMPWIYFVIQHMSPQAAGVPCITWV